MFTEEQSLYAARKILILKERMEISSKVDIQKLYVREGFYGCRRVSFKPHISHDSY